MLDLNHFDSRAYILQVVGFDFIETKNCGGKIIHIIFF